MSAEVAVKKRGRPRKVVVDPVELEAPETKKTATKAKSTKAAPKATKLKPAASAKAPVIGKQVSKSIDVSKASATSASKPTVTPPTANTEALKLPPKPSQTTPVTPDTSKILSKVRELSAKSTPTTMASKAESLKTSTNTKTSSPSPEPTAAKPLPSSTPTPPTPSTSPKSNPPPAANVSTPKPPSSPSTTPKTKIPIAAMNSAVVSGISERAGARPNTASSKALPKGYNNAAKKVTMTIVALPIAIVTSYVLYQRLVLGEEKKLLVPMEASRESEVTKDIP